MDSVQFNCPLCAGLFQVDPAMAGGQVLCPNCHGTVTIPQMSAPPVESPAPATSELSCPLCTGVFQVTQEMAGQQVSCPHCAGLVMIPGETPPPPAAAPPAGEVVTPGPQMPVGNAAFQTTQGTAPSSESFPQQNLYPPGFQPKSAASETPPAPSTPVSSGEADDRYPPGQAPKTAPQPTADTSGANLVRSTTPTQGLSKNQPSPSANQNLYPPGFESKTDKSEAQSASSMPAASDHRYPPGQAPKTAPVPTSKAGGKTPSQSAAPTEAGSGSAKDISSLLPPGAAGPNEAPQETANPADAKVEAMLPPGAGVSSGAAQAKKSKADELLPPGAETRPDDTGLKQRALPEDEKNRPIKQNKDIVIPTEDGGAVQLHEPQRTVRTATGEVRLHSLSQEEKIRKRSLKSLVMWIICVVFLIVGLIVLVNI